MANRKDAKDEMRVQHVPKELNRDLAPMAHDKSNSFGGQALQGQEFATQTNRKCVLATSHETKPMPCKTQNANHASRVWRELPVQRLV